MSRFCRECGCLLNDTDSVCPECGSENNVSVMSAEPVFRTYTPDREVYVSQQVDSTIQATNEKKSPVLLISVIAIVLLLGIAGGIGYFKFKVQKNNVPVAPEKISQTVSDDNILPKTDSYYEDTNQEDNSWLIGKWGPVTYDGGTFSDIIESITTEIDILDDHTLIETSRTKLTPLGIATAKSKGTYRGDITEDRETANYTVDNTNNVLNYNTDPTKQNRQSYDSRLAFDKVNQTLNLGSEEKPMYLRKQNVSNANNEAPSSMPEINQTYSAKTKAFFYDSPNESSIRKAYLAEGDVVVITKIQNGFGYTVFTNAQGQVTEGWVKMSELQEKLLNKIPETTQSDTHSQNEAISSTSSEKGIIINGVRWATRNVDAPGTFAAKPEDAGMFYQWNRKIGWNTTDPLKNSNGGTTWDSSNPIGDQWETANDPSPAGWRVPTSNEIDKLCDRNKVKQEWTTQNGIKGKKFTDKATGNSIFLPAAGYIRDHKVPELNAVNIDGGYWATTKGESFDLACSLGLSCGVNEEAFAIYTWRNNGISIRPVAE